MHRERTPRNITLLDILLDGFEKNEVIDGYHWRQIPTPDEKTAAARFGALAAEAKRWMGEPERIDELGPRRIAAWPDLEIRQAGRGILVRAVAPWLGAWWHDDEMWEGDPLGRVLGWLDEES